MAETRKSKDEQRYHIIFTGLIFLFALLGSFGLFKKLDYRFYDFLLRFRKEIPKNEKVVMVEIDDDSLSKLGEWPWSRDIMGDTLIRMKELGAVSASFDIEYLSPSKMGIASDAREKIAESINENKRTIETLVGELTDAITDGNIGRNELPEIKEELINGNIEPSYDDLEEKIIDNVYFDYDEYFARAVQFFGNVYLTINNRDLRMDKIYTPEYLDYVQKRILRSNVEDKKGRVRKNNLYEFSRLDGDRPGFSPAIEVFMSRAMSASFTNSVVDDDGIRRRMEFLSDYRGKFIPQLAVGPLLDNLQVEKVIRNARSVTLVNAKFPDLEKPIDLRIPLDEHGCMVINWRRGNIEDAFNFEPVLALNNLDDYERNIFLCLDNIAKLAVRDDTGNKIGFSAFAEELSDFYSQILSDKEYLLSLCTGYDENGIPYDGITADQYEAYFGEKKDFFENVKAFIESGLDAEAFEVLDSLVEKGLPVETVIDYKAALKEEYDHLLEEYAGYSELEPKVRNVLEGSYCIIGNTASSTTDIGATPFMKQYENVGIHGNMMNTILNRKFIYSFEWFWAFIFAVLISFIPLFFSGEKKTYRNISGAIVIISGTVLLVLLFVLFNIYVQMITAILYLIVNYLFGVVYRFINSDKEKKFITNAFSQCLSKDVVDDIIKDPTSLKLGGVTREMTAIFTDIQKFSSFSELLNAAQLVALLNYYLTKMSDIIMEERGTVDKYEGDAIIALVGAPMELPDHAFRACSAAIKMKKAEKEMNNEILEVVKGEKPENMDQDLYDAFKIMVSNQKTIFTRVGINSGEMVAGFMGSENKKNYTMMGNNVNLASRLEGVNKAYASSILCSQKTYEFANEGVNKDKILFRRLDRVRVVNINTPVQLYNLIGFNDSVSEEQKKEIEMFHAALDRYLEKDFIQAGKLFLKADKVYHDETAIVFAERCKKYIEDGVPENWDGVLNMTSK